MNGYFREDRFQVPKCSQCDQMVVIVVKNMISLVDVVFVKQFV